MNLLRHFFIDFFLLKKCHGLKIKIMDTFVKPVQFHGYLIKYFKKLVDGMSLAIFKLNSLKYFKE